MLFLTPVIILRYHLFITDPHPFITDPHLSIIEHIDPRSFIILYRLHVIAEIASQFIEAAMAVASHILEPTVAVGSVNWSKGPMFCVGAVQPRGPRICYLSWIGESPRRVLIYFPYLRSSQSTYS
jgi:hypothetical protein